MNKVGCCKILTFVLHISCRVGVKLPTVEVRYKNLCVEAECTVVHGKPLPTLWNTLKSLVLVSILIHNVQLIFCLCMGDFESKFSISKLVT